jgi:hypothetical protein
MNPCSTLARNRRSKKTLQHEMKRTIAAMKAVSDAIKKKSDEAKTAPPTYSCTMHPEVKSDTAGDCPRCGDETRRKSSRA